MSSRILWIGIALVVALPVSTRGQYSPSFGNCELIPVVMQSVRDDLSSQDRALHNAARPSGSFSRASFILSVFEAGNREAPPDVAQISTLPATLRRRRGPKQSRDRAGRGSDRPAA